MENKELRERMLSGKMYNDLSVELVQRREQAVFLTNDYNSTYGKPKEVREALLRKLLRRIGSSVHFEPNFRCEFGFNISIGNNFFANFDCIMLDGNLITIGDNVLLGPPCRFIYGQSCARSAGTSYGRVLCLSDCH